MIGNDESERVDVLDRFEDRPEDGVMRSGSE